MRSLLVALMLLVAAMEAASVPEFATELVRPPAQACMCDCGCECTHCRIHRDHESPASDGLTGMACSGCSVPGGTRVVYAPAMPYEVPERVTVPESAPLLLAFRVPAHIAASPPARRPDPPPRVVAA